MFLSHNIQQKDIQGWDAEIKQQWVTQTDQMGLYSRRVQEKPTATTRKPNRHHKKMQ